MGAEELLQRVIDKSQRQKAIKTIGFGTATQITDNNCVVLRDGQPELHDVRFHATETKPGSRITEIPADKSSVIYAIIENQATEAVILKCSEVERVLIQIEKTSYELSKEGLTMRCDKAKYAINPSGHEIAVDGETLYNVLEDLIKEVMQIIVVQGRGPNVPNLTAIQTRLHKILK